MNQEVFYTLQEAKVLIERRRSEYNHGDRIDHPAIVPQHRKPGCLPPFCSQVQHKNRYILLGQVDTFGLVGIRLMIAGFGRDWSSLLRQRNKANSSFTIYKNVLHSTPLHIDGAYSFIFIDLKENPWHKLLLLAERPNYNGWRNS